MNLGIIFWPVAIKRFFRQFCTGMAVIAFGRRLVLRYGQGDIEFRLLFSKFVFL